MSNAVADDEQEVVVVKRALQEHVDLDPSGTIDVLCSQCAFDPSSLDEEERVLRERIRVLIVNFLSEKFRTCIVRAVEKREVEDALLAGLKVVS